MDIKATPVSSHYTYLISNKVWKMALKGVRVTITYPIDQLWQLLKLFIVNVLR